jgi:hypothetical protein
LLTPDPPAAEHLKPLVAFSASADYFIQAQKQHNSAERTNLVATEQGIVTKTESGTAWVRAVPSGSCDG